MPTLAEATKPRDVSQLTPLAPATAGPPTSLPTPPGPGDGRNPFFICSHPVVSTADTLRHFYRQSVPQFRTGLFVGHP